MIIILMEEIFIKEKDNKHKVKELIEIIEPNSNKTIVINKETGKIQNNLEIIHNNKTGESKLINKETGEEVKGYKI